MNNKFITRNLSQNVILLLLVGLLYSVSSNAQQIKISEKPEEFIPDVQRLMAIDANAVAIEQGKKFEAHFNTFSLEQKAKMISLCRKMLTRGFKMPHYYLFFDILDKAIEKEKFSPEALDNLVSTVQKVVDNYDLKSASKSLESIRDFFDKRLLYGSNYNRLYALGGSYGIKFIDKKVDVQNPQAPANTPQKLDEPSHFDEWDGSPIEELEAATMSQTEPTNYEVAKKPIPTISGIAIDLKDVDLIMATSSDSVILKQTSGTTAWRDGIFIGKGGKFTWENAKMPQIFVVINDYFFEIRNPKFAADDVTLTYQDRLNTPIRGVFEYKSEKRNPSTAPTFPRFMSYQGDAFIKNIDRSIEYRGGFSLAGSRIYSSSLNNKFSSILVKKEGKYFFKATSTRFELSDSLITSRLASFISYIDKDSLSHPAVKFSYNQKKFILRLNKIDAGGFRDTPYSDSYHQMDIRTDALRWDLNSGKMDFYILSGKNIIPTVFESYDYFDPQRVRDLSGSAGFNPLISIGNYAKTKNKTSFTLDEIAQNYHLNPKIMFGGIMGAVQQGFVDYNPVSELYKITRKGMNYLQSFNGKRDFDDFLVKSIYTSRDSTANATLNLNDKSLNIRGVRGFSMSDSLRVLVLPYDQSIRVNKNRSFTFSGQIKTGNFRFAGKDLTVDYDNFTVDLNKIDSITFIPQAIYRKGGRKEIGGYVRYLKPGKLYINSPNNKSGKTYSPEYPKLVINEGVTVFFDERERGARAYNRSVHFDIPKIDYDSLNVRDIEFAGTFHSGGIFAPFQEKLVAMPDTTIGFTHKVPNNKYNVYGGESFVKFASNLTMDARGLHSEGSISHIAATVGANDIIFMTDSLIAKGQLGEIKEMVTPQNAYFPQVDIRDYSLKWIPKGDSMIIATKEGFNLYSKTSAFTGKLIVRTGGLFGIGKLKRTDSETASEQFKFNKEGFTADMAQLKVNSTVASAKPVLLGNGVNVQFNVVNENVNIQTNSGVAPLGNTTANVVSNLEFPYAAYKTNIDRANWSIKDRRITMKGDVNNSTFTSTNPQQEGLSFNGNSAIYEIEQQTLNIQGVPFIKTADAKVSPDKGQVAIRGNAEMLPFKNARLTVDTLNGYHNLINGNIQILSKRKFVGDATYQFVNVRKDTFNIKMGDFELKELGATSNAKRKDKNLNLSTVARASVSERDSVFLSPKMLYKGEIMMLAPNKNLSLDGFVIPELKKYPRLGGNWIAYKGNKSEEITIVVDKNLKSGNFPIFAGLFERSAGTGVYPAFLSPKESPEDHTIFSVNGTFKRDEPRKLYSILPEKSDPKSLVGNKYELLDEAGIIKLEGTFDLLNGKVGQYLQTSGFAKIRLDTPNHEFNTMMIASFPIQQPLLQNMAEKIVKTNLDEGNNEGAIVFDSPEFQSKFAQIAGDKSLEEYKLKAMLSHVPLFRNSPKFVAPIVFSDLKLMWSPKHNAFYSVGKLGVSNIGETDINTKIEGFVEIRKNNVSGDEVYIYLEPSPNVWYYFGYREGQMGIISSELAFNNILTSKADKQKKSKDYSVIPVDLAEAKTFRQDFMKIYLGLKPEQIKAKESKEKDKKVAETPKDKDAKEPLKKDEKKKKADDEKEGF